jgi:hypothetical protein
LKTTVGQKIQVEPSTGSWETRLTTCGLGFSLTSTAIYSSFVCSKLRGDGGGGKQLSVHTRFFCVC